MHTAWESELAQFLTDLSDVQGKTLDVLVRKREMLVAADTDGLAAMGAEEQTVIDSLQECLRRREDLLRRADQEGLPSESIRALTAALPEAAKDGLPDQVRQATLRSRLLQHHSLTNWVLVQRTMIHLSQLLEIIATGGRLQPTYGREDSVHPSGALVNQEA